MANLRSTNRTVKRAEEHVKKRIKSAEFVNELKDTLEIGSAWILTVEWELQEIDKKNVSVVKVTDSATWIAIDSLKLAVEHKGYKNLAQLGRQYNYEPPAIDPKTTDTFIYIGINNVYDENLHTFITNTGITCVILNPTLRFLKRIK